MDVNHWLTVGFSFDSFDERVDDVSLVVVMLLDSVEASSRVLKRHKVEVRTRRRLQTLRG